MALASSYSPNPAAASSQVTRRHKPDYQIFLYAGILILFGLIVLFAISPAQAGLVSEVTERDIIIKKLLNLSAGLVAFFVAASLPFKFWQRWTGWILLAGFGFSVLLALLAINQTPPALCVNGACRWFNVGFGSFQPAELLKLGTLLFLAGFLGRRITAGNLNSLSDTLVPLAAVIGAAGLLIVVAQKDMGTGLTLMGTVMIMIFAAGMRYKYLGWIVAALFVLFVLFTVTSPHRMERIATYFSTDAASQQENYHITQAKIAIGSGGMTGRGLGHSRQAFGYLPAAANDSIFAIFGETFGFVGLVAILGLFAALLGRLIKAMKHLVDPVMRLVVAGVFGLILSHVAVNVGAMTGVFPLTGVTLPFISFGGTSLLFTMTALGIVFQISRYTSHSEVSFNKEEANESSISRRGVRRTRNSTSGRRQST